MCNCEGEGGLLSSEDKDRVESVFKVLFFKKKNSVHQPKSSFKFKTSFGMLIKNCNCNYDKLFRGHENQQWLAIDTFQKSMLNKKPQLSSFYSISWFLVKDEEIYNVIRLANYSGLTNDNRLYRRS